MIKSFEHFSPYVKFPASLKGDFDSSIMPVLPDAIKKLKPYLGTELCDLLISEVNDDDLSPESAALIPYVRRPLARFMLHIASPSLDIDMSTVGYQTKSTQNFAPASRQRVKKFDDSVESLAWDGVEIMLEFLEDNKSDYQEWVDSPGYTQNIRNLVNSATEFDSIHRINSSRLEFMRLRPKMDMIDSLQIIPEISQDLFDDIITKLKEGASDIYPGILANLKKAEVLFAVNDNGHAETFMSLVKRELDENPDTYPLYHDSDNYRGDDPDYDNYENNDESGLFIGGFPCAQ